MIRTPKAIPAGGVTTKEAAEILGVTPSRVTQLEKAGKIKRLRRGKRGVSAIYDGQSCHDHVALRTQRAAGEAPKAITQLAGAGIDLRTDAVLTGAGTPRDEHGRVDIDLAGIPEDPRTDAEAEPEGRTESEDEQVQRTIELHGRALGRYVTSMDLASEALEAYGRTMRLAKDAAASMREAEDILNGFGVELAVKPPTGDHGHTPDPEVGAMERVRIALEDLEQNARERILAWTMQRFGVNGSITVSGGTSASTPEPASLNDPGFTLI